MMIYCLTREKPEAEVHVLAVANWLGAEVGVFFFRLR